MNDSPDPSLDRLLRQWADRHAVDDDQTRQLESRVRAAASEPTASVVLASLTPHSRPTWKWAVAATAAAIVLACYLEYRSNSNQQTPDATPSQLVAEPTTGSRGSLADSDEGDESRRLVDLWDAYRDEFGSSLAWIAEVDGRVEIGLHEVGSSEVAQLVAVRLTLSARHLEGPDTAESPSWRELESFQVVAPREQVVRLAARDGSSPLALWAFPVESQRVAVDVSYNGETQPIRFFGSQLQATGRAGAARLLNVVTADQEYRLIQTAYVLESDDIG
ncbi:MAG: hypothetical protein KDA61_05265 [Planctomycetales bacterium]|nr:hypothetical protein [Planctomycetales bacterium]